MHVIIIGSGPAGISAALYARRGGADVTIVTKGVGTLAAAEWIENYYGFPEPITGAELEQRGIDGAKRLGVRFVWDEALEIRPSEDGAHFQVQTVHGSYVADGVVLAAGAQRKKISLPGVQEFEGRGVSYCAICDAFFYRGKKIGDAVTAQYVYAHDAEVENGANLGQFNHIRPDSHIGAGVKIGNFVEVKNSNIGTGAKLPHLSYIGDCDLGARVNMGCGTITVNYDGKKKFRTVIGDDAFVGCNSNLVAPVTVGTGAYVAAGSTITRDVPAGTLSVARARQKEIEGWHDKRK